MTRLEELTKRLDPNRIEILNDLGIPVTLFANSDVLVEVEAIEQLLRFLSLHKTAEEIWKLEKVGKTKAFWGDGCGKILKAILTPDFHFGGDIPVGTVAETEHFLIPQAVGNDVCCGMRLLVTDLTTDEVVGNMDRITARLREIFFQGQRDIPMSPRQRESLLRTGLAGLLTTHTDNQNTGIWKYYDARQQEKDLASTHFPDGYLETTGTFTYGGYITGSGAMDSRDAHIGSIGQGNHFVEVQKVDEILDGTIAYDWGVKKDAITIMIHSGSVELGHAVGGTFLDIAKGIFPKEMKHPDHGFYCLPTNGPNRPLACSYWNAMHNAANFAFGNRLFLGLMAIRAFSEVLGRRVESKLVYDAPHNLIWDRIGLGKEPGDWMIHRKGACPAPGTDYGADAGRFRYTGHPVILPGSMGSASYLLAGLGNHDSLQSACHGAGRSLSRGKSRNVDMTQYESTFSKLHVVTPIDPKSPEVRLRRDVLEQHHDRLKEEAPYAYKDVGPVVQTVEDSHVAKKVARMWPLLTVKG